MTYSYPVIQGEIISINDLKLPRAKKIATTATKYPYCLKESIALLRQEDGSEVIILTLDIEVYQKNKFNGIQAYEDIAIICQEADNSFPDIYALREDFKTGLPHTHATGYEHPVCLCISEENFIEIKHKFNAFEFLENIRSWLSLTSQNKLHSEDQPLEPFFITKGSVIFPNKDLLNKRLYLKQISSTLYCFQDNPDGNSAFFLLPFLSDPQVHGFVRKQPTLIKDLSDFIIINGEPFAKQLTDVLQTTKNDLLQNKELLHLKMGFYCEIPVKRYIHDTTPSGIERLFFLTNFTVKHIGEHLGIWESMNGSVVPIVGARVKLELAENIAIDTYSVFFDFDRNNASIFNNISNNEENYTLIGVGALGSQVLSNFARMGFGKWTIIDFDILYPHNLARHVLCRDSLGLNKAESISKYTNELLNEEFATPINANFIVESKEKDIIQKLSDSKAIIDISTSVAVARILARDYKETIRSQRISAFLNPRGTDLVLLAEDKRRHHRLDFLEMQYYRLLFHTEQLHNHLDVENTSKVRYARNSCREITSRINHTDVVLFSSIAAKAIKKTIETGKASISIWQMDENSFEVKNHYFTPTKWMRKVIKDWKIYIDHWLINQMQLYRKQKLPKETGGVILGSVDFERKIIYIVDSIFAPKDSIEREESFIRGKDNLLSTYEKYKEITDNQIQYLGEWHSHPIGYTARPSSYDNKLFADLKDIMSKQGSPFVMGILADKDCTIKVAL
jgi:hypothetical protein